MIQKFTCKPPGSLLLSAIVGVLCPVGILISISDLVKREGDYTVRLVVLGGLFFWSWLNFKYVIAFIKRKSLGYIIIDDTQLELPNFADKSDKVNLSDIRYVTQTDPEDGFVKISTTKGFYRFYQEYMSPEDFEEVKNILQKIAENNRTSIAR